MGYTHYFSIRNPDAINEARWLQIIAATRQLLHALPPHSHSAGGFYAEDPLQVYNGGIPVKPGAYLSEDPAVIRLGGAPGLTGSVFNVHTKLQGEQCCETQRMPYDLVVCGVLTVIANLAPGWLRIRSDGEEEEWEPALSWVRETLGERFQSPLRPRHEWMLELLGGDAVPEWF